ncbi:uncharacterized protein [Periplaneta americana]|uniref:uncharacterized protein n=1 Tax=Periplaneta americana TaxID=6978 RepID=UPI0037E8A905
MDRNREESDSSDADSNTATTTMLGEEPSRKRHKKDNDKILENIEAEEDTNSQSQKADRKRKSHKKKDPVKQKPKFKLNKSGRRASVTVKEVKRSPLFLNEIGEMVICSLVGDISPHYPSRWCEIEYNQLSHIIVLLIEGLSLNDFQGHESLFPAVTDNFKSKLELITPIAYGGCAIKEMARVPLLCNQKHRLLKHGTLVSHGIDDGMDFWLKMQQIQAHELRTDAIDLRRLQNNIAGRQNDLQQHIGNVADQPPASVQHCDVLDLRLYFPLSDSFWAPVKILVFHISAS